LPRQVLIQMVREQAPRGDYKEQIAWKLVIDRINL